MHLVNGGKFLNITFLSALIVATVFETAVPLKSIYASLLSHKLDFNS